MTTKEQAKRLIDRLTTSAPEQPVVSVVTTPKFSQECPPVRNEFNDREQRMLDRLDQRQTQS